MQLLQHPLARECASGGACAGYVGQPAEVHDSSCEKNDSVANHQGLQVRVAGRGGPIDSGQVEECVRVDCEDSSAIPMMALIASDLHKLLKQLMG